jgi:hypothetical protein
MEFGICFQAGERFNPDVLENTQAKSQRQE